jgi:hypothetical protein
MCSTCTTHLIPLHFTILIESSQEHKPWISSTCSFLILLANPKICTNILRCSFTLSMNLVCRAGVYKSSQKPRSHIKIQGARMVPWNKFSYGGLGHIRRRTMLLVALSTRRLGFLQPWYNVLYEVYTAVSVRVVVLWVLTPCSLVSGYERFWGSCCPLRASQIPSSATRGVTTQHPSNLSLYSVLSVKTVFHTHAISKDKGFLVYSRTCVCAFVRAFSFMRVFVWLNPQTFLLWSRVPQFLFRKPVIGRTAEEWLVLTTRIASHRDESIKLSHSRFMPVLLLNNSSISFITIL